MAKTLPDALRRLLERPSYCHIATLMPDGSPQTTETWIDTDGEHVMVNTVEGYQKLKNVRRDPRVALNVADPDDPSRYASVRGRVVETTTEGANEHIEELSRKYLGRSYPYGWPGQQRVILKIAPHKVGGP